MCCQGQVTPINMDLYTALGLYTVADLGGFQGFWPNPSFGWTKYWTSTDDGLNGTLFPGWKTKETDSVAHLSMPQQKSWPKTDRLTGRARSVYKMIENGHGLTESGRVGKFFARTSHVML